MLGLFGVRIIFHSSKGRHVIDLTIFTSQIIGIIIIIIALLKLALFYLLITVHNTADIEKQINLPMQSSKKIACRKPM
jgi:hypothetical protein